MKRSGIHARSRLLLASLVLALLVLSAAPPSTSVFAYIKQTWKQLTRSNSSLALAPVDPKFKPAGNGRWPVYIAKDDFSRASEELHRQMKPADFQKIDL